MPILVTARTAAFIPESRTVAQIRYQIPLSFSSHYTQAVAQLPCMGKSNIVLDRTLLQLIGQRCHLLCEEEAKVPDRHDLNRPRHCMRYQMWKKYSELAFV